MPIQNFADSATEIFFETERVGKGVGWRNLSRVAKRKLDMLDYAHELSDLLAPPGNRLELLKGDWAGYHSIRINDQWRIVFRWTTQGPSEVQIIDYHC